MLIADTTTRDPPSRRAQQRCPRLGCHDRRPSGYRGLSDAYEHEFVNHTTEYVRGHVHTNGIENFWALLKRSLAGPTLVDPATCWPIAMNRLSASMSGRTLMVCASAPLLAPLKASA